MPIDNKGNRIVEQKELVSERVQTEAILICPHKCGYVALSKFKSMLSWIRVLQHYQDDVCTIDDLVMSDIGREMGHHYVEPGTVRPYFQEDEMDQVDNDS